MKYIKDSKYDNIKERTMKYLTEPDVSPDNCRELADCLYSISLFSEAYLFYSTAEVLYETEDALKKYYCLCMMAMCFQRIGRRWMYVDFLSKYAISLLPDNTEAYGIYCDNWLNDERSEARFNKYTISKICFKKKNDALKEIDRHGFLDRYRSMKFYKTLSEISKP